MSVSGRASFFRKAKLSLPPEAVYVDSEQRVAQTLGNVSRVLYQLFVSYDCR